MLSRGDRDRRRRVEAVGLRRGEQARRAQPHAERHEHRVAGDRERVRQRAAAVLAVRVVQDGAVDRRRGRVREDGARAVARWASSTPVSVTILNVEPGGWSSDSGRPAAASSSPLAGSITTIAEPYGAPASSVVASACSVGEIDVRTFSPARGAAVASARARRRRAFRRARPASRALEEQLEAGQPDLASPAGSPSASSCASWAPVAAPTVADDVRCRRHVAQRAAVAGLERAAARCASPRAAALAGAQAGERELRGSSERAARGLGAGDREREALVQRAEELRLECASRPCRRRRRAFATARPAVALTTVAVAAAARSPATKAPPSRRQRRGAGRRCRARRTSRRSRRVRPVAARSARPA